MGGSKGDLVFYTCDPSKSKSRIFSTILSKIVGGRMLYLISPKNSRGEQLIKASLQISGCWFGILQYFFVYGYNDVKWT